MSTPGMIPHGLPQFPHGSQRATMSGAPPQLEIYDEYDRLIIELVGFTFYPGKETKRISKTVKGLYRGAPPTWGKVPPKLKRQMFMEFKCSWKPQHEEELAQNFEKRAAKILKDVLRRACNLCQKPKWIHGAN
ncbi:hypothetical protein K7X08_006902 [Anisodus acutangulus]|uniref:Uncharacterized protein n=1 Tax=Anisodus acutangulus TaxID=402998 RepID=A0A9Q1LES1_9SOLA|nr:hypothetical protein K7X08_006902 [Anisodus acutangulus]